ncbi:MAG: hypothetical protein Q9196_001020 [Gyalolechia fulgens]
MAETAARQPNTVDFVLSCSICQQTFSAVYADHDGDNGLRTDAHRTDGSITKLWLTECAHVTCGKHLEGGGLQAGSPSGHVNAHQAEGVPFHPEDQPPKAPCPLCSVNNRDRSAKILYGIRGVMRGQYDESIPAEYLQVPAPQLGVPGNEALRFQYISLLRFASKIYERLLATEKELNTWKDRESSIVACLAASEPLARALQLARDQLSDLGGETSFIDDALHRAAGPEGDTIVPMGKPSSSTVVSSETPLGNRNPPAGSSLARGSAADLRIIQNDGLSRHNQEFPERNRMSCYDDYPPAKRKRSSNAAELVLRHSHNVNSDLMQQQLPSRDIMPPPPRRLQDVTSAILSRPALSRRQQYIDQSPTRSDHISPRDEYNINIRPATYMRASMVSEDLSGDAFESTAQIRANKVSIRFRLGSDLSLKSYRVDLALIDNLALGRT